MPDGQPPALVTEQMLMFGHGPAVGLRLRRLGRATIRTFQISLAAFAAPALYAHRGWYADSSGH
jgi:hypothetical protein